MVFINKLKIVILDKPVCYKRNTTPPHAVIGKALTLA